MCHESHDVLNRRRTAESDGIVEENRLEPEYDQITDPNPNVTYASIVPTSKPPAQTKNETNNNGINPGQQNVIYSELSLNQE